MTTLSDIEALARAATPGPWLPTGQIRDAARENREYVLALSPERVLAIIAVVKAADAIRALEYSEGPTGSPIVDNYDAARAQLEAL